MSNIHGFWASVRRVLPVGLPVDLAQEICGHNAAADLVRERNLADSKLRLRRVLARGALLFVRLEDWPNRRALTIGLNY
jgi:hypothetical protein